MGFPLRLARPLRPLRRRPLRLHIARRIQRSARRIRLPPLARLRHTTLPNLRPQRAQRPEFRSLCASVHQPEAHDGRV